MKTILSGIVHKLDDIRSYQTPTFELVSHIKFVIGEFIRDVAERLGSIKDMQLENYRGINRTEDLLSNVVPPWNADPDKIKPLLSSIVALLHQNKGLINGNFELLSCLCNDGPLVPKVDGVIEDIRELIGSVNEIPSFLDSIKLRQLTSANIRQLVLVLSAEMSFHFVQPAEAMHTSSSALVSACVDCVPTLLTCLVVIAMVGTVTMAFSSLVTYAMSNSYIHYILNDVDERNAHDELQMRAKLDHAAATPATTTELALNAAADDAHTRVPWLRNWVPHGMWYLFHDEHDEHDAHVELQLKSADVNDELDHEVDLALGFGPPTRKRKRSTSIAQWPMRATAVFATIGSASSASVFVSATQYTSASVSVFGSGAFLVFVGILMVSIAALQMAKKVTSRRQLAAWRQRKQAHRQKLVNMSSLSQWVLPSVESILRRPPAARCGINHRMYGDRAAENISVNANPRVSWISWRTMMDLYNEPVDEGHKIFNQTQYEFAASLQHPFMFSQRKSPFGSSTDGDGNAETFGAYRSTLHLIALEVYNFQAAMYRCKFLCEPNQCMHFPACLNAYYRQADFAAYMTGTYQDVPEWAISKFRMLPSEFDYVTSDFHNVLQRSYARLGFMENVQYDHETHARIPSTAPTRILYSTDLKNVNHSPTHGQFMDLVPTVEEIAISAADTNPDDGFFLAPPEDLNAPIVPIGDDNDPGSTWVDGVRYEFADWDFAESTHRRTINSIRTAPSVNALRLAVVASGLTLAEASNSVPVFQMPIECTFAGMLLNALYMWIFIEGAWITYSVQFKPAVVRQLLAWQTMQTIYLRVNAYTRAIAILSFAVSAISMIMVQTFTTRATLQWFWWGSGDYSVTWLHEYSFVARQCLSLFCFTELANFLSASKRSYDLKDTLSAHMWNSWFPHIPFSMRNRWYTLNSGLALLDPRTAVYDIRYTVALAATCFSAWLVRENDAVGSCYMFILNFITTMMIASGIWLLLCPHASRSKRWTAFAMAALCTTPAVLATVVRAEPVIGLPPPWTPAPTPVTFTGNWPADSYDINDEDVIVRPRMPDSILATTVSADLPTYCVQGYPDTQATCMVVNSTKFFLPGYIESNQQASTASATNAKATHSGYVRWGIRNETTGATAATVSRALCIPTMPDCILGTSTQLENVKFDTKDNVMTCDISGTMAPVNFDRRYNLPIVVNPPWANTPSDNSTTCVVDKFDTLENIKPTVVEWVPPEAVNVVEWTPPAKVMTTPTETGTTKHNVVTWTVPPLLKCHSTSEPVVPKPLTVTELCGGVGHTTHAWKPLNFTTLAYADNSRVAAEAFHNEFPDVQQFKDIRAILSKPSQYLNVAGKSDVVVVGAPCADHTHLNQRRDPHSDRSRLVLAALEIFLKGDHQMGLFELVPDFLSILNGTMFGDFISMSNATHHLEMMHMNPVDHGGVQTRKRVYALLIRRDVADSRPAFEHPQTVKASPQLIDFLETRDTLDIPSLIDVRPFVRRYNTALENPAYRGAHADFNLPFHARQKGNSHFRAYSVYGMAPTQTTTPTVIYDPELGLFRRLSPRETMNIQGYEKDFQFPASYSDTDVYAAIGKGMDLHCLRALGVSINAYLRPGPSIQQSNLWQFEENYSPYDKPTDVVQYTDAMTHHIRLGHPSNPVQKLMGYPALRKVCPVCASFKSKKAKSCSLPIPKGTVPFQRVHMDIKISAVPDRKGVTRMLGFTDTYSNDSWVKPIVDGTTHSIKKAFEEWRVHDIKNAPIGEVMLDNDSAFTSQEFSSYLANCSPPVPKMFSCAYHQHQNGVAEHLWARLGPLTTYLVNCTPWLGPKYWTEAMVYANECLRRRPSEANPNNAVPYERSTGRKVNTKQLRPWGCVVYVHDDDAKGFTLKARKGYLLGLSQWHADGVYDILMADTKRVRQTMNVIFCDDDTAESPDRLPLQADFDFRTKAPTTPLEACDGCVDAADPNEDFSKTFVPSIIGNTKTIVNGSKYPSDAIVTVGPKTPRSIHGKDRVKALNNKTVLECLNSMYYQGGRYRQYQNSDMYWDKDHQFTNITAPVVDNLAVQSTVVQFDLTPSMDFAAHVLDPRRFGRTHNFRSRTIFEFDVVNSVDVEFDTTPLSPVENHVEGLDIPESEWFNKEAIHAITARADSDPLNELVPWTVGLSFDGTVKYYEIVPDRKPHDFVQSTDFRLSTSDTTFCTHRSLDRLKGSPDEAESLQAIASEYGDFDKRNLWKLCPLPNGADTKQMMLLGKVKMLPSGKKEKTKFRAVILGNDYIKGRDCGSNTYAPCAQICTARCMLHDALCNDKCFKSCDIKQAFTFGKADKRVFVKCPPGKRRTYGPDGEPLVYEIIGNCYGSPGAPRRWNVAIHNACIAFGMTQSTTDAGLYCKGDLSTLIYTDDFLSTFPNTTDGKRQYAELIDMLTTKFELGDDGWTDCENYIGMHFEFNSDRTKCIVTQPQKINELLDDSNLAMCKSAFTTGVPNTLISLQDCPSDEENADPNRFMKDKPYRRRIGQLSWISRTTRPDIAYQVNALSSVAHNAGKAHWDASTHLIKYISHTSDFGLVYHKSDDTDGPRLWSDATWAPNYGNFFDNYRSTTGWVSTCGGNVLNWTSHRQSVVAQSSAESEWYAAADAAKEASYVKNVFTSLGIVTPRNVPLMCDNQSTIKQSLNAVDQQSSRHLGMRSHYLRQQCHSGDLNLQFVPSADQLGDIFTKVLATAQHEKLRAELNMMSVSEFRSH